MADYGTGVTDKAIADLDNKIKKIYSEAARDIQKKMDDFNRRRKIKDAIYKEKLHKGEITQEDYDRWYDGQVFQSKQWIAAKYDIVHILANSNQIALNMINKKSIHVFSVNATYQEYLIDSKFGLDFGFELYDSHTVTNLIMNDPRLLPKWKINEPKDYIWNGKKLDRQVTQGIIQGESLDKIAKRIATALSAQNMNKMKTFARTAMTGAQNAGRYQGLQDAKTLGLHVVKQWMATLDFRTRATHRAMDGEKQKVGDKWHPFKFSNGCRFPGDPECDDPSEIYGCRCTLVGDLIEFPAEFKRYDNIDGKPVKGMSYEEWYNAKKSQLAKQTQQTSKQQSMQKGTEDNPFSRERKHNALWADTPEEADNALRQECGDVWRHATNLEKDSICDYTMSYHKFNEPLRGIEYGTSRKLGVGNTNLNAGYQNNGNQLNAMTNLINKSFLPQDMWFQRGLSAHGSSEFLGVSQDFLENASEEELKNALLGTTPKDWGFFSMGSSKGSGFNSKPVIFYVYAPKGTNAMYVEPFSYYGKGDHRDWNGVSTQTNFGLEVETILQQGTRFRVTKVRKGKGGKIRIDIEVIGQDTPQFWRG